MTRKRHIVALFTALLMTLTACGGGDGSDGASPVDIDTLQLSDAGIAGRAIFSAKCTTCHRTDLTGGSGPALGPGSAAADKPITDLVAKIVVGGTGMPAWGGLLSDQEIDGLAAFLSEAQGR